MIACAPTCLSRILLVAGALVALLVVAPPAFAAPPSAGAQLPRVLKLRNRTPFILYVYVAGVRVGWIKPFRTEVLKGLRHGYHKVYLTSRYGSGRWGPRRLYVPGNWNLRPSEGSMAGDASTALASRLYRRNRSSLVACDHLARRRGEDAGRAELVVRVDAKGKATVRVNGEGLSGRLRSCYLAVASRWQHQATGEAYTMTFSHFGR